MSDTSLRPELKASDRYSATVDLSLVMDGLTIPLAQIGHDRVILTSPHSLRPGRAEVLLHINGILHQWAVEILPHEAGAKRIPIADLG